MSDLVCVCERACQQLGTKMQKRIVGPPASNACFLRHAMTGRLAAPKMPRHVGVGATGQIRQTGTASGWGSRSPGQGAKKWTGLRTHGANLHVSQNGPNRPAKRRPQHRLHTLGQFRPTRPQLRPNLDPGGNFGPS